MVLRSTRLLLLPLAALAVTGCRSVASSDEVVRLVKQERYGQALDLAAARAEEFPDDAEAQALHTDVQVAILLENGRNAVFERRYEDALDALNVALDLSPQNEVVQRWIMKARGELTRVWLDRGLEYLQTERYEQAIEAYELAEYYSPRHPEALFGATRVLFLINYRQGLGEDYYNQGVRAIHSHLLTQARQKFIASDKYVSDDPVTAERRARVEGALAEERLFVAAGFEEEGNYGAALIEYRIILTLEEDNADALDGLERMSREVEANRLLSEADKLIRQARFDEALAQLDAASELTEMQVDRVGRMTGSIEEAHWAALYRRALDEEQDYRYPAAIASYDELLALAEHYEDATQRRATLVEYVERAEGLYAQLETAATPEEELSILRQISLFWPEYLDVPTRLAALEEAD